MKWLSTLLGRQGPTAKHPFVITEPTIGFLNLAGQDAAGIAERDRAAFAAMFAHHVVSVGDVPQCDVLFLYCRLDEHGVIPGQHLTVGQVIAAARAYVAVIALDNPPERYQSTPALAGTQTLSWSSTATVSPLTASGNGSLRRCSPGNRC